MSEAIEGLIGLMREQGARNNPPSICIGKVVSINPIEIKTGDLPLYRHNLLMSDVLTLESYLEVGDAIALMPTEDMQTYIALCKVV